MSTIPPPLLACCSTQTLSDPEKRMAYDAIAGYEIGGVNPFVDTSYERDQVGAWGGGGAGFDWCWPGRGHSLCPA